MCPSQFEVEAVFELGDDFSYWALSVVDGLDRLTTVVDEKSQQDRNRLSRSSFSLSATRVSLSTTVSCPRIFYKSYRPYSNLTWWWSPQSIGICMRAAYNRPCLLQIKVNFGPVIHCSIVFGTLVHYLWDTTASNVLLRHSQISD